MAEVATIEPTIEDELLTPYPEEPADSDVIEQIDENPRLAELHQKILEFMRSARIEAKTDEEVDLLARKATLEAAHIGEIHPIVDGMVDKKGFERRLNLEIKRAQRLGNALTLVLIDGDHFKDINDSLGHDVGDDVIHIVGMTIVKRTRESDIKAGIGGDEAAIIMPDTTQTQALLSLRKLFPEISEAVSTTIKRSYTNSAGIANFIRGVDDARSLFKRADEALYHAKTSGHDGKVAIEQPNGEFKAFDLEEIDEITS